MFALLGKNSADKRAALLVVQAGTRLPKDRASRHFWTSMHRRDEFQPRGSSRQTSCAAISFEAFMIGTDYICHAEPPYS